MSVGRVRCSNKERKRASLDTKWCEESFYMVYSVGGTLGAGDGEYLSFFLGANTQDISIRADLSTLASCVAPTVGCAASNCAEIMLLCL